MVGVPKSTGCLICRKRKIKCDETWPTCINCKKNGKTCPGQPARHTFRECGQSMTIKGMNDDLKKHPNSLDPESQQSTPSDAKGVATGAIVYKFRLSKLGEKSHATKQHSKKQLRTRKQSESSRSAMHRSPSLPTHTKLAQALVHALEVGDTGYRISALGSFLCLLPPRIGHNIALDAAVSCLVHAHSAMLQSTSSFLEANIKYSLDAVQKLKSCLEDPEDGVSSNTLCAALTLSVVEALTGPQPSTSYLTHVGGAGRLLEILGPENCQDDFARHVLNFARGGAIITSIYRQEECFLLGEEWSGVAFDKTNAPLDECLWIDVEHAMADFSVLLKQMNNLERCSTPMSQFPDDFPVEQYLFNNFVPFGDLSEVSESPLQDIPCGILPEPDLNFNYMHIRTSDLVSDTFLKDDLLQKLFVLKASFTETNIRLTTSIHDGTFATELPSSEPSNPLPTSYAFTHWRIACVYATSWAFTILVNKAIIKLLQPTPLPLQQSVSTTSSTLYALDAESRHLALELCKTWESAWLNRPIGACHVWLGHVVAFKYCTSEVQAWVLECLNRLLQEQGVREWQWTEDLIEMTCRKLMGEGDTLGTKI